MVPLALALGASLLGCDAAVEPELTTEEVVGGQEAPAGKWSSVVSVDTVGGSSPYWCGGTYVAPGWVLTAAHCITGGPSTLQVVADRHDLTGSGGVVAAVRTIIRHPQYDSLTKNNDIALLELDRFLRLPTANLAGRHEMNGVVAGESATAVGWGDTTEGGNPSPRLQEVDLDVIGVGNDCEMASGYGSITDNQICIGVLAGGRDTCQGDSGGPAFIRRNGEWVQLGITSWGSGCARPDLPGVYTLVANYRQWIGQTIGRGRLAYTPGDFDEDGRTDLTITTAGGSFWYFSNGDGSWREPYVRTDLPSGEAEYTPGDFDGDGKSDLVITTGGGSFWYVSVGNGSWAEPYTNRSDLPLGAVNYVPGDFNRDGKTDLIFTTASGSSWYFSNGPDSWFIPYSRTDLPLGAVEYVPGDFDGDRRTDLVVTTAGGSFWYFSNGDGTWREPYTRSDLPRGSVAYTPGDFDGDGSTDLIVTTASGSYWYFSNGDGTWREPYIRTDLRLGKVEYTPGDFDGDGLTDLVVTTSSGSYWYFSNGDGTWRQLYVRTDLPLGQVRYTPGDFDGDALTDLVVTTTGGSFWYFSNGDGNWFQLYTRTDLPL